MDSFNEYLNKKKELAEYTTSYQLDEGIWDSIKKGASNLKNGIGKEVNAIGRTKKVEGFSVTVDLNSNDLIKKIINKAEEEAKTTGAAPDYKAEIIKYAKQISEGMFNAASGKVKHGSYGDANLYKDFQYITIAGTKIAVVFKPSYTGKNPKKIIDAAAKDFKEILINAICQNTPRVPENAIKIEDKIISKGYSKWMNQSKDEWSDVEAKLEPGIETLAEELSKNMDQIQKRLEKIAIEADRDNKLGEDVTAYYIRWIVKANTLEEVLFNKNMGNLSKINPSHDKVAGLIAEYVNNLLLDLKFIEPDGTGYKLTAKDHGFIGLTTTESSIRFYFKDKSLAEHARAEMQELENLGSVNSVKRPAKALENFDKFIDKASFLKCKLFNRTVVPYLEEGRTLFTTNVVFDEDQKEKFSKFLKSDDTADIDEIKKFIGEFINIANTKGGDDFIGMGADSDTLYAYCASKGLATALTTYYKSHSLNAKLGVTPVKLDADALKYLAITKDCTNVEKDEIFGTLKETLQKIVESGICDTAEYATITVVPGQKIIDTMADGNDEFKDADKAKSNLANIAEKLLEPAYNDTTLQKVIVGPYINGAEFNIVFKADKDSKDAIEKYYTEHFKNAGLEDCTFGVIRLGKNFENTWKCADLATAKDKVEKNSTTYIKACEAKFAEIVEANQTHPVINVELTEDSYKAFAEEVKSDDHKGEIISAIKKIISNDSDDIISGFYILNNNLRFILKPKAENGVNNIKDEVQRQFSGAEISDDSERYSTTTLQKYAAFKNDIDSCVNADQAAAVIMNITSQAEVIKANKELDARTKFVAFVPINDLTNVKGKFAEDKNAFEILKTAITNTLNEINKYTNDSSKSAEKNPNYIGYFVCQHKGKPCVAYVFNKSEATSAEWYKKIIGGQNNSNSVETVENYVIPEFELTYIKNTKEDLNNLKEEHIKIMLQALDEYAGKIQAAKEKDAMKCFKVEVGIDSEAWANGIAKDNTVLSNDDVANEILNGVKATLDKCLDIDDFIGVVPAKDNIKFIAKSEESCEIILDAVKSTLANIKYVGANKSYKIEPTSYKVDFQQKLKHECENINNAKDLGELFSNILDKANAAVSNNQNGFVWKMILDFSGINAKKVGDLVELEGNLMKSKNLEESKTFQKSLSNYLMNLLSEASKKAEPVEAGDRNIEADGSTEHGNDINNLVQTLSEIDTDKNEVLNQLKTNANYEINKVNGLANAFIKHYCNQFIKDGKMVDVKVEVERPSEDDFKFRITFTGDINNCKKYYQHIVNIATASNNLFKIVDKQIPNT